MAQKTIFPDRGNPVVIDFTFKVPTDPTFGLLGFDEVFVTFREVTYSSVTNPTIVEVASGTQLKLFLGTEVSSGDIPAHFTIWGVNNTYPAPNGYLLTNKCYGNLGVPCIC